MALLANQIEAGRFTVNMSARTNYHLKKYNSLDMGLLIIIAITFE